MNIKTVASGFVLALAVLSATPASAEEYIYRELMANTLASKKCADKPAATANALDAYTLKKYKKRFCETQGYGWNLAEEKNDGKVVCQECGGEAGKFQCRVEDIVVTCKRLKPGSVGLIPGQG